MNWSSIIFAAGLLLASPKAAGQTSAAQDTFTTDTPMAHDPVMAFENGTYYLYCTGENIAQMTSSDRRHWTVGRQGALPEIPAWTRDSVPGFESHVWAPDVIRYRGKWYMAYSCSTFGKNTSAIGLLSNSSLAHLGGWKDEGCLVSSREGRDNWNAIDPAFILDRKGRPWLVWGSFWDGIQMAALDPNTMHIKKGARPKTIARRYARPQKSGKSNGTGSPAPANPVEAPFILRHGDYFYLFVSWDYCCRGKESTYRVAVGRSRKVDGPYTDAQGRKMTEGGGSVIFEGDKKEFEAAGHCAAYNFNGEDIFICHGYSVALGGASILVERPIEWTADGWPAIR